jgi:AcrR family transcriptional regulator
MRSRILAGALDRFREAGFEETTVAEICEAADVAYGTFFNHFPAKLDLLRAIVDDSLLALAERVEALGKAPGPTREKLGPLFELLTRSAREFGPGQRDLVGRMVALGHQESPADRERRLHTIFRGFFEVGAERGDVREDELDGLTEIVLGAYTSLMLGWVHFDDYPVGAHAETVARLLQRILTHREGGG